MQIQQALALYKQLESKSESAVLDVEMMLCHLLKKPSSYLFTWPDKELDKDVEGALKQLISRRSNGEPIAHILGSRGFWDFDLEVSPQTLIPRPDTEVLVEQALALCVQNEARVADLGTGTGAIALALAWERPKWQIIASDYIPDAAALAERNRQKLKLDNVQVVAGSWFEPHSGKYDLIVSNPPYIDPADPHLQSGDVRFEPLSALTAENSGMADIELISQQARDYLLPNGVLLFEHGFDQGERCRELLAYLGFSDVETAKDYGGNDRVTFGRWLTGK
jgi:release factor glutamine methyltransferase